MENTNTGNANDANNPNQEWISEENRDRQVQGATEDQVNSFNAADDSNFSERERNDSSREDDDTKDDEDADTDWGTVDPLDAPGSLPDPMDPSGPGSAV